MNLVIKLLRWACLCLMVVTVLTLGPAAAAWSAPAPSLAAGSMPADPLTQPLAAALLPPEQLFDLHCAGCHAHGGNIVRRGKTLKQKALQRQGLTSTEAITQLITNGKGAMSAYRDRLSPEEIQSLAQYVEQQAAAGW